MGSVRPGGPAVAPERAPETRWGCCWHHDPSRTTSIPPEGPASAPDCALPSQAAASAVPWARSLRKSRDQDSDRLLAFAASARLRRVVSIIALIAFVLLPRPPLYHIPGNRQARESANLRRLVGALGGARTHPAGHRAAAAAQPRVEQVAWRVADHVQAVHHQGTIGNCFPPSRCGSWLAASATKRGHSHGFDHAASRRPRRVTGPRPCAVRGHDGGRVVS